MQKIKITLIRGYRYLLSPWFGNQCRFYPSCSAYAEEAIQTHGSLKGLFDIEEALKKLGGEPAAPGTAVEKKK